MVFEKEDHRLFKGISFPKDRNGTQKASMGVVNIGGNPAPIVNGGEKIFSDVSDLNAINVGNAYTGGRDKALDGVSLTIPDGCIYGFLGSNGAGKSTLMRMMCGVYKTDIGSIKIDGQEVYDNAEAKKNIFFVNDETIEYTGFTLESLMMYYRNYYPETFNTGKFTHLANVLNLPMNSRLSTFSKGMKRQAVVIIGLSSGVKYLLLDEAFDGLDPAMREMVKNIILDEIRSRNATLIVSSHNIHEIGEMCDRAMLINNGKIVFAEELSNIKGRFVKYQLASLVRVIPEIEIYEAVGAIRQYKATGKVVQVIVEGGEGVDEKIRGLGADLVEEIPMTLEEVFIHELNKTGGAL